MRDLADYAEQYGSLPFEQHQARMRRRHVLDMLARHGARSILEVGCGLDPIFTSLDAFDQCVVVEPAASFAAAARARAASDPRVQVHEALIEHVAPQLRGERFDMILLSSFLHERSDPVAVLRAVRALCGVDTVVHVNVPNARSLHRLLAVAMGLIDSPYDLSPTQRRLQQSHTFDVAALERLLAQAGFRVVDSGSYFVKPFTHAQMEAMLERGIIDASVLDGLDALARDLPGFGSEIYANAVLLSPTLRLHR